MCRAPLRRVGTLALLASIALAPRSASSAPQESPLPEIHLTYVAPRGCPTRGQLLEDLGRRVHPAWHTGADPRRFAVRIERLRDGSFSGTLEVSRPGREVEQREFDAETCDAVSSALVVFIAIALDPASSRPEHEPAPDHSVEPEPVPSTMPTGARREPAPRPAPARSQLRRRSDDVWEWTSSVGLFYLRAPLDGWGPRVDAEIARTIGGGRIAPALRVSWGSAGFQTQPPDGGTATFRIRAARVSACAKIDLAPAPLVIAPCAGFEHGSLGASSSDLPQVGYASSSWSAVAGLARASFRLLPWLAVEAEVGLDFPFSRPAFALNEPVRIVYRPPRVLFTAGAGLAVSARFR